MANLLRFARNPRRYIPFRLRRDRNFSRDLFDFAGATEQELIERFRFSRNSILYLENLLHNQIAPETERNHSLSVREQLLIALRFFASGSFLQVVGDTVGPSKSTVSRVVRKVALALCEHQADFIKFPVTPQASAGMSDGFFLRIAGFPGCICCIDCTHVRIQAPSENEPAFVNRKNFHNINVQAVCDHKGKFTNIVAKWLGSVHDSHVFNTSSLGRELARHNTSELGTLLGDSGYACKPYLLTPYLNPTTRAQERFNRSHKVTRTLIERVFGIWKRRFHCLHAELRMSPGRVCNIIGACAVLHNIAIIRNEPLPDGNDPGPGPNMGIQYNGPEDGRAVRDHVARAFFS
ncbi:putative nuclease HARBI1 [Lingula anatina]|uniref:Putative nuclease HARBI1 n=1 Tax=Lingula anatina TaxID=7574 RepID=A0A1S3H5B5_LINAN|nr:putative nuclease HARBI1 [Lingula anatina]|eukprot:XP_013381198.1 putative nuclease HARBI1 [Lingula anatina]